MTMMKKITAVIASMVMLAGLAACGGATTSKPSILKDNTDGNTLSKPIEWDSNSALAKKLKCMTRDEFLEKYKDYTYNQQDKFFEVDCAIALDGDSADVPVIEDKNYYGTINLKVDSLTDTEVKWTADASKFAKLTNSDGLTLQSERVYANKYKKNYTVHDDYDPTLGMLDTDGAKVEAGGKATNTVKLNDKYTDGLLVLRVGDNNTILVKPMN